MRHLSILAVALVLTAAGSAVGQERNPEMAAASEEWLRYYNAGQYDAAIAAGLKRLRLADQLFPGDTLERAEAANTLAMSYHSKRDLANAQLFYERSLAIHEKLGGSAICRTMNSLGDVAYGRLDMASAARLYERALTCFETLRGPADSQTIAALFDLIEAYNYPVYRPDLAAKADLLAQRWLPLLERAKGPDDLAVVRLLREQGKALAARREPNRASAVRERALAIAAKQRDAAKPDKARLVLEAGLAEDLASALTWSHPDHIRYTARKLAVLETLYGAADSRTVAARAYVAKLLTSFPEAAVVAGIVKPAPAPVRQVAAPVTTPPAGPQVATPTAPGRRLTPRDVMLKAPAGYAQIKPAQMYSISIDALGDPRWIVARSPAEAAQIGQRFYGFYDRFNGCLNVCPGTIALDFGWVAIIQAFRPGDPNILRDTRKFGVYVAYGAATRQGAIDGALAEYRANRGSDGPIMQSIRVGLVSEIDWPAVEAAFNRTAKVGSIPNMDELNYKTFCDWSNVPITQGPLRGALGPNMNPEPTTGNLDRDPKCTTQSRPGEKLPPPVLVAAKR